MINCKECGGKQKRNLKAIPKTCQRGLLKQPHACQNSFVSPTDTGKAILLTVLHICTTSRSTNMHNLIHSHDIMDNVTRTEPNWAGKSKWPQKTTLWQAQNVTGVTLINDYITSFMLRTPHLLLLRWSNPEEWDVRDTKHTWGTGVAHTGFWWGDLRKGDHQEDLR